jgi:hypothetical protein
MSSSSVSILYDKANKIKEEDQTNEEVYRNSRRNLR